MGKVGRTNLVELAVHQDKLGRLCVLDLEAGLPFVPKRLFTVTDVPADAVRGCHANRYVEELLICVKGSLLVSLHDGTQYTSTRLNSPAVGLYLPPMIWSEQFEFSPDAVLVVLASLLYDAADYIRDFDAFLHAKRGA